MTPNRAPDFFVSKPTPPEGEHKCDFCSSLAPKWSYPCRDFVHNENAGILMMNEKTHDVRFDELSIEGHSIGNWAACPVCHLLIERGDRERLARRSAKRLLTKVVPELAKSWPMKDAVDHCRRIQDDFWKNRMGAPTRIEK
jgi:hypothetical protein